LESDSKKRSKPRLRFNFSNRSETRKASTTRDEILNSLSRQTQPGQQNNEDAANGIRESANPEQLAQQDDFSISESKTRRKRHAGRSAFLVFAGGFLAVWAYGFVTRAYDIPGISTLTSTPEAQVGIQTLSANPVGTALVLAGVFLVGVYIRHRRKSSDSHLSNSQQAEYDSGWT
jgi:hypothetical protein